MKTWPGQPYPLGATWDGSGVNFAIFSENATGVELCLFDRENPHHETRLPMSEQTDLVWHIYLPEARPGTLYGYRVKGPYAPLEGHRFNANKLLRDPYARAVSGLHDWDDALFGYTIGSPEEDLSLDDRDSAPYSPKCVVVDQAFSWGDDRPLHIPWDKTVIYEAHVKGLTARHPLIAPAERGTYAGLSSPHVIEHLLTLGVTAIELLPVHHFLNDRHLVAHGLSNYWGYNSINFFAPHGPYASLGAHGEQVAEFKTMVKTMHREGIEVILDVVYNHTGEGNHLGPTLCFRGIDNAAYYRLMEDDRRYYMDFTGTGNTLNMTHPRAIQLIMDSLRYWVTEMHVDGFRFDLASTLARELYAVDRLGAFFDVIHQDPVISQAKLIAEPWDLGEGGYQVGNFPVGWTEWNDEYRNTVRRYWKGDARQIGELAYRLTGSSDLYESTGRRPFASINFITAHDGFSLRDLVSYNDKHNEANGEGNRDGTDNNLSWNCGVEGPTEDVQVRNLRARQQRNLLATLIFSQGVPMLLGGDEIGHSKDGNNNTYCQDSELSWQSWDLTREQQSLLEFARKVIGLRKQHPVLRRRSFFRGRSMRDPDLRDVSWLRPDGREMTPGDWEDAETRSLGMVLAGDAIEEVDDRGNPIHGATLLLLLNAHHESLFFTLPACRFEGQWQLGLDTRTSTGKRRYRLLAPGESYSLLGRSLALFEFQVGEEDEEE